MADKLPDDERAGGPVERPDDAATPEAEDYGGLARRSAAWHASMADVVDRGMQAIRQALADATPPPNAPVGTWVPPNLDPLFASIEQASQRTKLIGALSAAEALAWDRMQEAGGPDDPQAFAEFKAASEFHTALATDAPPDDSNINDPNAG